MDHAAYYNDRRLNADRRQDNGGTLSLRGWRSRRSRERRGGLHDAVSAYVDWYEPKWLLAAAVVVVLSCMDAAASLFLLTDWMAQEEARMALLLRVDAALFVTFKLGMAVAGLVMLVGQYKFNFFRGIPGARLLPCCLLAYGVLVAYELGYFVLD